MMESSSDEDDSSQSSIIDRQNDPNTIDAHDDDIDIGFRNTTTSTSTNRDGGRRSRRSKQSRQNDAIYGVFYDSFDDDDDEDDSDNKDHNGRKKGRSSIGKRNSNHNTVTSAPIFVPAKTLTSPVVAENSKVASNNNDNTNNDAGVSSNTTVEQKKAPDPIITSQPKTLDRNDNDNNQVLPQIIQQHQQQEETEKEQNKADQYFMSLLQKAKSTTQTKKRKPIQRVVPSVDTPSTFRDDGIQQQHSVVGLDIMGAASSMPPTSFGRILPATDEEFIAGIPKQPKDPSLAKWEKHTKGIGSKLLAKMGWTGSGGHDTWQRQVTTVDANMLPIYIETYTFYSGNVTAEQR